MELARCGNIFSCNKILHTDNLIHQVRYVDGIGETHYAPCCCQSCANVLQQYYINLHYQRMQNTREQSFQIMKLKDFG